MRMNIAFEFIDDLIQRCGVKKLNIFDPVSNPAPYCAIELLTICCARDDLANVVTNNA